VETSNNNKGGMLLFFKKKLLFFFAYAKFYAIFKATIYFQSNSSYKMNAYKNASYVGFVLSILGTIVAVYGFSFLLTLNALDANGVVVKGTVFQIEEHAIYRSPWVRFNTVEGKEYVFLSELEQNKDLFPYIVGQEVDVIYDKDNPRNARINAFWERNFAQIFLGIFGVFLMFFGLFVRWQFLRKAKKYS
jgi:hypothetical protein